MKLITFVGGSDTYKTAVSGPGFVTQHGSILATGKGAVVSFDNGATDALVVPAGVPTVIGGAQIPSEAKITVKNLIAGQNFTRVDITLWPDVRN